MKQMENNEKLTEAKRLWALFANVPLNENEDIDADFMDGDKMLFKKGTDQYEIWHWFEETFNVSIVNDLMFSLNYKDLML